MVGLYLIHLPLNVAVLLCMCIRFQAVTLISLLAVMCYASPLLLLVLCPLAFIYRCVVPVLRLVMILGCLYVCLTFVSLGFPWLLDKRLPLSHNLAEVCSGITASLHGK